MSSQLQIPFVEGELDEPWAQGPRSKPPSARPVEEVQRLLEGAATWHRHESALSIGARRSMLRSLVLCALVPVTALLATRLVMLGVDPILGLYAVLMLTVTCLVMYISFAHYRDRSEEMILDLTKPLPLVSFLVAVKNESEMIERCIRSIFASSYPNLEVLVVDDGSDDDTPAKLDALQQELDFTLLRQNCSTGKKKALTEGAALAKGDFLLFTDSDTVLHQQAVERVMCAFTADRELGACSGHARAYNADTNFLTRVQDTWYDGQFGVWKAAEAVLGAVSCISGPLAAFRREAIYNYFPAWANDRFLGQEFQFATDRQLTGYVLGQFAVGKKLKRQNPDPRFLEISYPEQRWRVGYVRSARVQTAVPWTVDRLFKQQVRWKKSFIRNLCFTGGFYWRRGPLPTLLFYSHALFVLMMPVMAFRHLLWYPLHGRYLLSGLYLAGVFFKGSIWGIAYKLQNPHDGKWVYRPFMSIMTALFLSGLIIYSAATLRKGSWSRG